MERQCDNKSRLHNRPQGAARKRTELEKELASASCWRTLRPKLLGLAPFVDLDLGERFLSFLDMHAQIAWKGCHFFCFCLVFEVTLASFACFSQLPLLQPEPTVDATQAMGCHTIRREVQRCGFLAGLVLTFPGLARFSQVASAFPQHFYASGNP